MQALLLLQGRPQITASELAAELEVSVPTARRDLEALAMSGVPIYPARGRGGGWRLIGGARTDLTGLTQGEVTSLLIGLTQSLGAEPERVAAVRKLVRAMPAPFREGAQRVAAATVRDVPWGEAERESTSSTVAALQAAIADELQVRATYDGSGGERVLELVPLVVGSRGARWYLLGAPVVPGGESADPDCVRTYRVDRIREVELLPQRGIAPDGFDGSGEWARMVERVEGMRGRVRAILRVKPWAVRAMLDRFGVQARMIDSVIEPDDPVVEVRAHRADALAEQLAAWASVVEVVEPAEVRSHLRQIGERLVEQYRDA
ncbi:helix-turn-helix transcriptional regulator [Microbacterium halophytorum]|uniref:helix-turn-helix transcriptional regulator n=1 Tax=Microbacterium halophytorum TaxID=2067568 RepID=UPI0022779C84|nr:WYL domain-containing protein [Microbacterium halophytorum]